MLRIICNIFIYFFTFCVKSLTFYTLKAFSQTFLSVFLQQRTFLRTSHPTLHRPRTAVFLCGPREPRCQKELLCTSPRLAKLPGPSVLCGEFRPSAGTPKTLTVSLLLFVSLKLVHTYIFAVSFSRTCKLIFRSLNVFSLSPCTDVGWRWLSVSACCSLPPVFAFCPIEKECDLNKHLKVRDPERKKLCSRELICNVCFRCCSLLAVTD